MKPLLLSSLAATLLLFAGCATTYQVQVNALQDPAFTGGAGTYILVSGQKEGGRDLQFQEVARYVQRAMAARGFREAANPAQAQFYLLVDFGVGDPVSRTYTLSTPIYAELGGGVHRSTTTSTDSSGKTVTTTQSTVVPGRYERVGTDTTTQTVVTYRKHLRLSARLKENDATPEESREIWTVTALSDDQRADLRASLPMLTQALEPYINADTRQAINVEFKEQNGALVPVR